MPIPLHLSLQQARNLQLAAQGLLAPPTKAATRADVRKTIRRMQLLQIDTIHVVARSPYLVLFSRLGAYQNSWLEQLLANQSVFEAWAHEACFVPIEDYALHRSYSNTRRHWGIHGARRVLEQHRPHMDALLRHICQNGAVKSSDFDRSDGKKSGGWWGWKDEKRWLEAWFALGELMIVRRDNFSRVYDLTERVHPAALACQEHTIEQVHQIFIARAVKALGIAQARWINDYFRTKPKLKYTDLAALLDDGTLMQVTVEGWSQPAVLHRDYLPLARKAAREQLNASHATLLSPFDPLVWDRERALAMFNFDYRIECYTPEAKRKYGYFVLPILVAGQIVGRLDAKAHRSLGVFEIKALYLEAGIQTSDALLHGLAHAIRDCANWHQTPTVQINRTSPVGLKKKLTALLQC
jgi:uncharacterized protein YcaQ